MKTRLLSWMISALVIAVILVAVTPGGAGAQPQGWWLDTSCTPDCFFPDIRDQASYKVGIGTKQPASKFHVMQSDTGAGGSRFNDAVIAENNGNSFLQIIGNAAGEKSVIFAKPMGGADGVLKYNFTGVPGGSSGMTFWVNGNQYKGAVTKEGWLWGTNSVVAGRDNPIPAGTGTFWNTGANWTNTLYAEGLSGALFTVRYNGSVGINVPQTAVTNILTVQQNSPTDPIADAWTVYSSRRWKTNIQTIEGALDIVKQLRGVSFNWKANGQHDIGLVAEEVGQVVPEVVAYEENGIDAKSVDYNRLVAILIQAVKEQQAQIDKQQAMINALTNEKNTHVTASNDENALATERITALEQEVATLKAEKATTDQKASTFEARLAALEKAESASPRPFAAGLLGSWPLMAGLLLAGLALGSRFRLRK